MRRALACLLAAALTLLPVLQPLSAYASSTAGRAPSYRPGFVAGTVVSALHAHIDARGRLSQVLSVESQIKAAYLLETLHDEASARGDLPSRSIANLAPVLPSQARAALADLDAALKEINWHDLHDERIRGVMLEKLEAKLPALPARGGAMSVAGAVALLRPALENADAGANPWELVFDGVRARAASSPVDVSKLVPRSDTDWRAVALEIMTRGSLNVSRTAAIGRIYTAEGGKSHEEVKDLATANFRRAAEFVLDNADTLPLSLETVIKVNKILTKGGLVPESIRGNPYYNGDPEFHVEVRQFYEWLASAQGAAFAREHPIELAERLHYVISHFDEFLDSNGRTARLMADLVLIKAGMAPAYYTDIDDYFTRGSVRSGVSPAQRLDYFRELIAAGQEFMRADVELLRRRNALKKTMDPSLSKRLVTEPGYERTAAVPEVRASVQEFIRLTEAREAQQAPLFKRIKDGFRGLPASFKYFVAAGSILSATSWGIGIIMSVYGIKQWGLLAGLGAQALSLGLRIPGSLFGARILEKMGADSKRMYIWTTSIQVLQLLSLPVGLWLFGAGSVGYLIVFMAGQGIYGLIYGSTYGMAENQIMRRMLGSSKNRQETAGFLWTASREIFSLGALFILSPILLATVGADKALLVYAAMIAMAIPLFAKIKYLDEAPAASGAPAAAAKPADKADRLPLREYLPYISAIFVNSMFYALVGVFALYTFGVEAMSAYVMTAYVAGRALVSLIAAFGKMSAGPEAALATNPFSGLFTPKGAFGLLAAVTVGFMISATAGWAVPALAAALVLGVATALTSVRWMASYQNRLKPERMGPLSAVLSSLGVGMALLPFVMASAGRLLGVELQPVLWAITAVVFAVLGISAAVTLSSSSKK